MNYLEQVGLGDYEDYEETTSCFLDGRYWNIVLGEIEGVSTVPLKVTLKGDVRSASWAGVLHPTVTNFIRVVIETNTMKHAALLIVDFESKRALFWNPVTRSGRRKKEKKEESGLCTMIEGLVKDFLLSVDKFKLKCKNHNVMLELSTTECPMRGHCNAYVIRKVLDFLDEVEENNESGDSTEDILRFSAAIEDKYSHLLEGNVDEEYFWGLGAGLVGGALIGSALASRPAYVYPAYSYPAYGYGYPPRYGYGYRYPPGYGYGY